MFWDNFVRLCKKNGTKPNPLAKKLGIASGTVTAWKNGSIPQASTLLKLADYFDVTPDYLLGKEPITEKLPTSNEEFMDMLRAHNKGKAQVFFCGADGKVIELSPEEEQLLKTFIEIRNKKE